MWIKREFKNFVKFIKKYRNDQKNFLYEPSNFLTRFNEDKNSS